MINIYGSLGFQVSVRVRDKADHSVMSIPDLLSHFKEKTDTYQ